MDHFHTLMDCGRIHEGHKYFEVENMRIKADRFVDMVRQWCSSYQISGSPSFMLTHKFKVLKDNLKKWNVKIFENVDC